MANYGEKNHYPVRVIDANGDENDSTHPLYTAADLQVGGTDASPTNPVPVAPAGTPVLTTATGAAAIALTYTRAGAYWLDAVSITLSAAPVVAGSLTITLKSAAGAGYDAVLSSVDPSTTAATVIVYRPETPLLCATGETIEVAYANPSAVTYGATIRTRSV